MDKCNPLTTQKVNICYFLQNLDNVHWWCFWDLVHSSFKQYYSIVNVVKTKTVLEILWLCLINVSMNYMPGMGWKLQNAGFKNQTCYTIICHLSLSVFPCFKQGKKTLQDTLSPDLALNIIPRKTTQPGQIWCYSTYNSPKAAAQTWQSYHFNKITKTVIIMCNSFSGSVFFCFCCCMLVIFFQLALVSRFWYDGNTAVWPLRYITEW